MNSLSRRDFIKALSAMLGTAFLEQFLTACGQSNASGLPKRRRRESFHPSKPLLKPLLKIATVHMPLLLTSLSRVTVSRKSWFVVH